MSTYAVSADGRGISRTFDSEVSHHTGILDQYFVDGDPDRPYYEHSVEAIAAAKFKRHGGNLTAIQRKIQVMLKDRATQRQTMWPETRKETKDGRPFWVATPVYLDLDGTADRIGRDWALDMPAIYFATFIEGEDSLFVRGKSEGMAIYWDPAHRNPRAKGRSFVWNGVAQTTASDWDERCYLGIVRTYSSFDAMDEARDDLIEALAACRPDSTPSDEETDPDVYCTNGHLDEEPEIEFTGL